MNLNDPKLPFLGFGTEDALRAMADALPDGLFTTDLEGRIDYWNRAAEQITGFSASEVVGRCCCDNVLNHVNENGEGLCHSACPLATTLTDGQPREGHVYLRHKAGHRVPVAVRTTPLLDATGTTVGAVEIFTDMTARSSIVERIRELERLAMFDRLTMLANRRYLEIEIQNRLLELQRYGWPFGLLFIDIDQFKDVNDRHGHVAGDQVLKAIGQTLLGNARPFDLFGRWGGEEFLGVIKAVDRSGLSTVASRLRLLVENTFVSVDGARVSVTVSMGATAA